MHNHPLCLTLSPPSHSPQYEYKVKGVRKKRCYIEMSVGGVKITRRKSKRVSPVKEARVTLSPLPSNQDEIMAVDISGIVESLSMLLDCHL